MTRWDDTWPATRLEAHYGDRVVRCFAQRPGSLHALLQTAADRHPDNEALVCGSQRLTYRQLLQQSARLAAGMSAHGVRAGDRVALLLGNRIEFVLTLFAAARLGAISVPISIREQTPGLAYMLNHCAAVLLVHEDDLAERLPAASDLPALRHRVAVGDAFQPPTDHGSDSAAIDRSDRFEDWLADGPAPAPAVAAVQEQDTAVILYTSGTTGRPKGAMLSHLGIVHSSMHFAIGMGLGPSDSSVAAVPLSHVTGLVALVTTFVHCAGKLVIMPAFKAADFLALAEKEKLTHGLMVPAMYNLCLIEPSFAQRDLSAWRVGAFGGAPMPASSIAALAARLPGLTLMNCYGSTESTSPATLMPQGQADSHRDTVGVPLHCAEMCVMDDDGRQLPTGELGEIWIKGPMVVRGYWDNPQATADNFTAGYWRSGDLGSIDGEGHVRVLDRKKDMINRGGYKIFTIEVENALYQHAAVQECAVVAKPCPVLGERVHAFVSLKPGEVGMDNLSPTQLVTVADALKAHCATQLADYKVPESFTLLTTPLPRNANGKLVKRAMRDEVAAQVVAQVAQQVGSQAPGHPANGPTNQPNTPTEVRR